MARKDRAGNRKTRDQRTARYIPQMGYYLVVTDTEATERCYFTGLHDSLPENIKKKLVIKVVETKTQNLIQKCLEMTAYEAQYRIPWIVYDRDQVPNFNQIVKEAEKMGINVGWSNSCFENGCLHILEICPLYRNHGLAALDLENYIRRKQDKIILKQMRICIRDSVNTGMKIRHFRLLPKSMPSV